MAHEFNDAELAPCDVCGGIYPYDEMTELDDGLLICPDCMDEMPCGTT